MASHKLENLGSVTCTVQVRKELPSCEHAAIMPCYQDPATHYCQEVCRGTLSCCSRTCKSKCGDCQSITLQNSKEKPVGKVPRLGHRSHPCERPLYCQHLCGLPCSQNHECNTSCRGECRQRCSHTRCRRPCHVPCAPCMEPCMWKCEHASCPVSCGAVSTHS